MAVLVSLAGIAGGCGGSNRKVVQASELPLTPATATEGSERIGVRHVVEAGQTLWRIAKVYEVAVDELARANGIDDPASLVVGQNLLVPGATDVRDVPPYPAPLTGTPPPASPRVARSSFDWPVPGGRFLSGYGAPRRTHRHEGIDIGARRGQPVRAAAAGRVVYSGATMRGYGKTIVIDHGDGYQSLYAHNDSLLVDVGRRVEHGEPIALVGRTGNASGEHCHFEIRQGDMPIDPLLYLLPPLEASR